LAQQHSISHRQRVAQQHCVTLKRHTTAWQYTSMEKTTDMTILKTHQPAPAVGTIHRCGRFDRFPVAIGDTTTNLLTHCVHIRLCMSVCTSEYTPVCTFGAILSLSLSLSCSGTPDPHLWRAARMYVFLLILPVSLKCFDFPCQPLQHDSPFSTTQTLLSQYSLIFGARASLSICPCIFEFSYASLYCSFVFSFVVVLLLCFGFLSSFTRSNTRRRTHKTYTCTHHCACTRHYAHSH
jgi:hypothetical protein